MNRSSRLPLVGLFVWLAGCASASAPETPTSSARVGGLWVGSAQAAGVGPVELSLTQRGDSVGGTAEAMLRGEVLRGLVDARLNGSTLQGSILGSSRTATFTLTLEGAVLKGSLGGSSVELRRQGYLAGSVYRSGDRGGMQSP